ncbi:protein rogdi-like [Ruditapes philippinarum]|uniref:protein rogdi-like n=1 Tax=Ruditapes philippinarum TaxID=129788 RepID=UPI00295B23F0|nr:protein rogdi-like [Ruditapes philippinarum]
MEDAEEQQTLERELRWLLEEQVHKDLVEVHHTLLECSRRFPYRMGFDDRTVVKPQRNLLSNPSNTGQIKCVVTLLGDSLCDADISFKHKSGKDNHIYKTKIGPDGQWSLQQIQDAANHLGEALSIFHCHGDDHKYTSAREVILVLEDLLKLLTSGRTCLSFPKRKSIEELVKNTSMQNFQPPVPNDVAVSFYVHSSKLILAIYHLYHAAPNYIEIVSRHQVECTVQWLNEAVVLFTLAIQQCQQLYDKIRAVMLSNPRKSS